MLIVLLACQNIADHPEKIVFPEVIPATTYEDQVMPTGDVFGLHEALQNNFSLYTHIIAPNGRYVHLLSQSGVSQAQLIRARSILAFYLQDREGLFFGDKSEIFNAMADTVATLLLFDSQTTAEQLMEGTIEDLDIFSQDLYATESLLEGSSAWLENTQRDATFEKTFHLVYGAGIDQVLPALSEEIEAAAQQSLNSGVWTPQEDVLTEWQQQESIGKEYMVRVIDVYYGLWAHSQDAFYGEYQPNNRGSLMAQDLIGKEIAEQFFPPSLDYEVRLDEQFTGIFDAGTSEEYGYKSQYFEHIRLMGNLPCDVVGNGLDNRLQGNQQDNLINGGFGEDTVIMSGMKNEYEVQLTSEGILLFDMINDRDGTDHLVNIEWVQFSNDLDAIEDLQPN